MAITTLSAATSQAAGPAFTLTSPDFADNTVVGTKYGASARDCGGQNLSPALHWANPPAGTKSFAIVMMDPDGQKGLGVWHWLAYGIPATKTSLAEGEASVASSAFLGGTSTPGLTTYYGPCPPVGDAPHHYIITLIGSDLEPSAFKPGLKHDELAEALKGHALGATSLIARYARN